jgi:hypothetical protein
MWRFYTEDSPGIKVGPVPVLVMSLLFIASVFMLHIWPKNALRCGLCRTSLLTPPSQDGAAGPTRGRRWRREGQAQESIKAGDAAMRRRWRAPDAEESLEVERR